MHTFNTPPANGNIVTNGRYILPQFEEKTVHGIRTQDPYSRLFRDRIIFLGTQIDDVSANDIMSQLLVLESINPDSDITMFINSPGGSFFDMTAIYDTMKYVKPKVKTVCLGQASSAAAILLAGGEKGYRAALPNARIMIHQPSGGGQGSTQASDVSIQAKEIRRIREWLEETLVTDTGTPLEKVSEDLNRDYFLSAEEAVKYGIIDEVLKR